jgi:hypothetical protein
MSQDEEQSTLGSTINRRQQTFIRYFTAILIDLTVLNFIVSGVTATGFIKSYDENRASCW